MYIKDQDPSNFSAVRKKVLEKVNSFHQKNEIEEKKKKQHEKMKTTCEKIKRKFIRNVAKPSKKLLNKKVRKLIKRE